MAAISLLNPKAEVAKASQALALNIAGARGIHDVMKTNLGPKGTMKLLVSGSGDIKVTKDGNVLLHEMQIQHPTANFIARVSTMQDDMIGDGTTSIVLLIGELLKQAETYVSEGVHPRILTEGFEQARAKCMEVLDKMKIEIDPWKNNGQILREVASTALHTKLNGKTAKVLTDICVDAIQAISQDNSLPDLHMVEIIEMQHKTETDTCLIKGLVLDHGGRHPNMPKWLKNAYILTCNLSMEYEKSELNSGFFYKSTQERERFLESEREFITQRVQKVIDLKRKLCTKENRKSFMVINQKGIDPLSLDMLASEGILALRRAKRRNMERLALACGGVAVNSVEDLDESVLGYAGQVYEYVLGENKFTFVEKCKDPKSVTILVKAPSKFSILQIKDAVRDGLRAVLNTITDKCVVPGAAAFELKAHQELQAYKDTIQQKSRMGIVAFSEALLVVPKVLAMNSGFDQRETVLKMQAEMICEGNMTVGLDVNSGEPMNPVDCGIYDNFSVKKQVLDSATVIASNLLLVDEIMRAGLSSLKG